jgi:hypothetical protein
MLPDPDNRGRALLVESAEGGAGALRRLVDDRDALALAARSALEIMHFDPVTGEDLSRDEEERERCVLACYECLLSYANQNVHGMINRHLVRDWLLQLAAGSAEPTPGPTVPTAEPTEPASPQAATFLVWLRSHNYRLPDEVDTEIAGARPDLIYRLRDGSAAVFVTADSGQERGGGGEERSERAKDDLRDLGWSVITVGDEETWPTITSRYPSVFGAS